MKKINIFIIAISSLFIFSGLTNSKSENQKKLSIEDAVKSGMFKAEVKGLGGHSGECIILNVVNLTSIDTTIYIEAGRRLNSVDSNVQDILIVREVPLLVRAGEEKNINLFGFCCQATNAGPSKDEAYDLGHMADSQLVKLAVFLNKNPFD